MFTTNLKNNLFLIPVDNYFSSKKSEILNENKNFNFENYNSNIESNKSIKDIKDLISKKNSKSKNFKQNVIFTDCLKNEWEKRILIHKIMNICVYNNNHNKI